MSNYILILVWIVILGIAAMFINVKRPEVVCGEKVERYYVVWAFLIFVPLIIWCGYRGNVGDTSMYISSFYDMPSDFGGIETYMQGVKKDKAFFCFSAVIKCLIGNKPEIYFIILALIQATLLILVYRKYSPEFLFTFFLFIASTDYISWMFNGIRQFMAVTITFACFGLILKKKYIVAILLILLASRFHGTALIVIPFLFVAQGKAWNKKTILVIMATIAAVTFIGSFTNLLDSVLAETQYTNVVSDWQSWQDDGTNIFRVLVYAVPAILSFIGKRYLDEANNPCINFCANMSIISTAIYVVSMFTSGIFIGRLPIYFSLYSYILLPWELKNMFNEKSKQFITGAAVLGYLGFYFYSIINMGMI